MLACFYLWMKLDAITTSDPRPKHRPRSQSARTSILTLGPLK